jgi:hypothetical protein
MSATTTDTTIESKKKSENSRAGPAAVTHSSASEKPSQNSKEASVVSRTYLRDAAEHLLIWMNRMQGQEISPANVNAVCNIAQQVANIVKVNIEIKKSGM